MRFTDVFAVPEPEDEPEAEQATWTAPAWFGPSDAELPFALALNTVIGRSENAVISLSHCLAYSTGVALEISAQARNLGERETQRIFHEQHVIPGDDPADAFIRIGVELGDGSRTSNLASRRRRPESEPKGPVLVQHGGGGGSAGQGRVSMRPGLWLWPIPPPGPLRLSCEWPIAGIALSTIELDSEQLRDACAAATPLWG